MTTPRQASAAVVPCKTHLSHDHRHGEGCGHKAVPHDGHVDYLHDGHVHRVHGDHTDECIAVTMTEVVRGHAS
jgi:hypothetical protein